MTLKTDNIQIGQNATATQNFVLKQGADGTCTLARGNVGATTQDVLTVDASGKVNPTQGLANSVITAPMLNGAQSGSAPIYGARAWCTFDGTVAGTNAPTAGGNVSTVTRNSTGNYTVNFSTALPSANYSVVMLSGGGTHVVHNSTKTTTSVVLLCHSPALAAVDSSDVSMIVIG